ADIGTILVKIAHPIGVSGTQSINRVIGSWTIVNHERPDDSIRHKCQNFFEKLAVLAEVRAVMLDGILMGAARRGAQRKKYDDECKQLDPERRDRKPAQRPGD